METSNWSSRWVPALAATAVSIAALCAAIFGGRAPERPVQVSRPAADAPVDVVRVPASAAPGAPHPACDTCELGAARSNWL